MALYYIILIVFSNKWSLSSYSNSSLWYLVKCFCLIYKTYILSNLYYSFWYHSIHKIAFLVSVFLTKPHTSCPIFGIILLRSLFFYLSEKPRVRQRFDERILFLSFFFFFSTFINHLQKHFTLPIKSHLIKVIVWT